MNDIIFLKNEFIKLYTESMQTICGYGGCRILSNNINKFNDIFNRIEPMRLRTDWKSDTNFYNDMNQMKRQVEEKQRLCKCLTFF